MCLHSDDLRTTLHAAQFDRSSKFFHNIVKMGANSDDRCEVVMRGLSELRERIDKSVCESSEKADPQSTAKPSKGDCRILSPVVVRRKGRKVERVEAEMKRKNEFVRKKVNIVAA